MTLKESTMRTRQAFSMVGRVILSLLLMTVVFKPHMVAGNEGKPGVVTLLQAGADVNLQNTYGDTALITATVKGFAEIVRMLLQAGADVNAKTEHGNTALTLAIEKGHAGVVEILKKSGARE